MERKISLRKVLTFLFGIIAVICVAYGAFVRAAGSGTLFFAVWFFIAACFCCLAVSLRLDLWKKVPNILRKVLVILVCAAILIFTGFQACVLSHFGDNGVDDIDYIIVLGAQVYRSGPSTVLRYRLDRAEQYMQENENTICIVSGGKGSNEPSTEAEVMAEYLESKGIGSERIIKEETSETTAENIANSIKYIKSGSSAGIVTNNFHVLRAMQTAKRQGLKNAYGIAAGSPAAYLPNNMLREFTAEIKFVFST